MSVGTVVQPDPRDFYSWPSGLPGGKGISAHMLSLLNLRTKFVLTRTPSTPFVGEMMVADPLNAGIGGNYTQFRGLCLDGDSPSQLSSVPECIWTMTLAGASYTARTNCSRHGHHLSLMQTEQKVRGCPQGS